MVRLIADLNIYARRFCEDRCGASAVEFAIVSVPFLALLGAIVQTAFVLWAGQNLDNALQDAARSMIVGSFQTANANQSDPAVILAALRANLCGATAQNKIVVFNCQGVKLDVAVSNSFGSAGTPSPVDPTSMTWKPTFGQGYVCAGPGAIVTVTAAVEFPIIFSLLNPVLKTFANGSRLLLSTTVFRTEPYQTASGSTAC